jgi:flagellar motor switch protein FliM
MDGKVSKEEMDALLNQGTRGGAAAGGGATRSGQSQNGPAMAYDFARPNRVSKAMLQSLERLHDKFCTNLSGALSGYLRTYTEVTVRSVEQTNYGDFLSTLPDPSLLHALSMRPLNGSAALQMDLDLVFPLIDLLTGGSGASLSSPSGRKITEIEETIVQGVVTVVIKNLSDAWRPVVDVTFNATGSETRPQLLQVVPPNEVVTVISLDVKAEQLRGNMHLCVPYAALEPVRSKFEQDAATQPPTPTRANSLKVHLRLLQAPLEITASVPPTMILLKDLMDLNAQDVITLDATTADPIQLEVGGSPAFYAQILQTHGRKAARVVRHIDRAEGRP